MAPNSTLEKIRKTQITDAALKTISEVGIQNITMDDIVKESGFSKGGIAHYYSSKDDLIHNAFEEFFNRIFAKSKLTMEQYSDPLEKLLSFEWLYNWEDPDVHIGYSLLFDSISIASHSEEYRLLLHSWVDSWITLLSEAIEEGNKQGIFNVKDVQSMARLISSIYNGIATRWYIDREGHPTEWAVASFKLAITSLLNSK